jgi:hypothetical protein
MEPTYDMMHISRALTTYSEEYTQADDAFVASLVCPNLPVDDKAGQYWKYNQEDFMRDEVQERAAGTPSVATEYGLTKGTYAVKRWALKKILTDEDFKIADSIFDLHADATELLTDKMLLKRESDLIATAMTANSWDSGNQFTGEAQTANPTGVSGGSTFCYWSDRTNSSPVDDILNAATDQQELTGKYPNTLIIGPRVFLALKMHPDIKDQYQYVSADSITVEMLARVLEIDNIYVPKVVTNTARRGQTPVFKFSYGKDALLCYTAPNIGPKTATSMVTLTWSNAPGAAAGGQAISEWVDPETKTNKLEIEAFWASKVVATRMGSYFTGAVA